MSTITRDLPYFGVDYTNTVTPGDSVVGSDVVSTTDTASEFVLPNVTSTIDSGHYGVGSDFINYPTDIPDGYTLTGGQYVVIAYAEATDTIPVDTSGWGYVPAPLTEPFLRNAGNGTINMVDGLPSGGYAGEIAQRAMDPTLLANGPAGTWRIAENLYNGDPAPAVHVAYLALRLTYTGPDELSLPCDTDVALDLSTATLQSGQYVDGVITGLDGTNAQFWFPFEVDPVKKYRVTVTFDPSSAHDGDGDPGTSDRFILLYDAVPGDEGTTGVQVYDGFSNTDDVSTFTIGPGISNWDDATEGVAQGFTRLLFQTSASGAVSAITIRKVCTSFAPPRRLTNRGGDRFSSAWSLLGSQRTQQGGIRLTAPL